MSNKYIKLATIAGVVVLFIVIVTSIFSGNYNRVVSLEENINNSNSNISKEEKRRIDLFNNIADAVQSYNQFEQSTLEKIIQARQQANGGQIESAQLTLAAVVEQYPQLRSQENYKQAILEFSITENRIAGYREQYNNDVRGYNKKVRSFPSNITLSIIGYQKQDFKYLDYDTKDGNFYTSPIPRDLSTSLMTSSA